MSEKTKTTTRSTIPPPCYLQSLSPAWRLHTHRSVQLVRSGRWAIEGKDSPGEPPGPRWRAKVERAEKRSGEEKTILEEDRSPSSLPFVPSRPLFIEPTPSPRPGVKTADKPPSVVVTAWAVNYLHPRENRNAVRRHPDGIVTESGTQGRRISWQRQPVVGNDGGRGQRAQ